MRAILQNSAARPLLFLMVDSTDHISGKTGLTPTVLLSKNGGTFASPAGSVTEVGRGWYQVAANATDSNTLGPLVVSATGSGADPSDTVFEVVAYNPSTAWLTSLGTNAPANWINAGAIATDALTSAKFAAGSLNGKGDWNVGKTGYSLVAGTGLGNQTANITGNVTGSVGTVNAFAANSITSTAIADNAFTAAKFAASSLNGKGNWNIGKTGYSLTQTFPTNFASLGINASGHISRVTLCDTNTDMRGTDGALLSGSYTAPANGDITAIKAVTDKLDTGLVLDGSVYQWTINALELAPAGGGGGSTDWTADERAAIRAILGIPGSGSTPADPTVGILDTIRDGLGGGGGVADWTADQKTAIMSILGIPASGTTPTDPTVGILDTIRDNVGSVPASVWASGTRTLSAFGFSVTVGANNDKAGYSLAVDQAVNVNKVGGVSVSGPADLKADLSGVPALVWNSLVASFPGVGSTGAALAAAGGSGDPWGTALPGAYLVGTAGHIIGTRIDVATSSVAGGGGGGPMGDHAIKLEINYQGNGVANAKASLVGTTAAVFTDANGLAQLNVSANTVYTVRITPPDGYQFVADFAVQVLTADVTVPITLAANSLPAVVPPLRVTYDEIRRHVGRFLGFGSSPDAFEASQSLAVEDTIRQGLRDVYFPSINGAPYEWSFLKRYTELQFSGGGTFALPTSFVRLASQVTVPGLGYPLRQVSESALRSMAIDSSETGPPIYYALSADGDALQLGVTLYRMRLFPVPPADSGYAEFWYHTSPEIDLDEGGPLGGIDLAATIVECCLARAELAQNVESLGQGGGVHLARSQEMLRRSIEADRALQAETLSVSMADQMRPQQQ